MVSGNSSRRHIASLVLVFGILITFLGFSHNGPIVRAASEYSEDIAKSSAAAYVSLRVINAAISFAEEVEVGGSVIAVNGSAHPFKVLEPIDDAVERLSAVIFFVGAISGVLTVLLPMIGGVAFILIGLSLIASSLLELLNIEFPGRRLVDNILGNIARLGGFAFLLVLAFSTSSWFAEGVSDKAWGKYQLTLNGVADEVTLLTEDQASIGTSRDIDHKGEYSFNKRTSSKR